MSLRFLALAAAAASFCAPANASLVLDYSLYSLGNYTDRGGSTIGGGIAVAGNASINATAIGVNLGADRNGTTVVAVGSTVSYDNSTLARGNVVYGGTNTSGFYTQAATPGGGFFKGDALDFSRINTSLLGLSASYGGMATTGNFTTQWGAGQLTGGATTGTDIFALSTNDLGGVYALQLLGAAGSKAVINISGNSFGSYFSFDRGNYAVSDITFNFVDTNNIVLNGLDLAGSILAPLATISQQGGRIAGTVVAGNFIADGANINGQGQYIIPDSPVEDPETEVPPVVDPETDGDSPDEIPEFDGGSPGAVPEPATWAMLITGFGFVGGAMRRRATAVAA